MATTARAISNLDTTATDIMDTQSDSGFDYDDGDIELDLDPTLPDQHQDDDLSIHDAPTDAGFDAQTVTADQDDFMEDHEEYGDGGVQYNFEEDQEPQSFRHSATTREHAPTPPDDDLIDYSDEEDDVPIPVTAVQEQAHASDPTSAMNVKSHQDHDQDKEDAVDAPNDDKERFEDEFEADHGPDDVTGGDNGGVQPQELETQADRSENPHDVHEEQRLVETQPITVNYEGNELWLFKQHDTDDSGDWLVDDISIIHASLSDLFHACRTSLGEDISSETELGLRFDHLHNMELWEDNTACVAVSLERLTELYYTLQAQDGEIDPESFYMCLLSRPRFATLLSDVAKHAEQGSGYSGLSSAIAAGETHFADAFSGDSTEHEGTDWGNEDGAIEEEQQVGTESTPEAEVEAKAVELHDQNTAESGQDEEISLQKKATMAHNDTPSSENVTNLDQKSEDGYDTAPHDNVGDSQESVLSSASDQATQQVSQSLLSAQEEQLANDIVDYSDQEDEDEVQAETPNAVSSSSSTVHGDNTAYDKASPQAAEPTEVEPDERSGFDEAIQGVQSSDLDHDLQFEDQLDDVVNHGSHQDYNETYDLDDAFQEFQADAPDADPTEPGSDDPTNQEYTGNKYQDLDQQVQNDFIDGTDVDDTGAGESTHATFDYTDGDDFLDLDNAADWATDSVVPEGTTLSSNDTTTQHEEAEDGVAEQPAVAASSAADPVAASSTDLQHESPQGKKRSIDEVGDSVGDALDLTDMKRPRV